VCVTSNVQTGAAASRTAHPIRALWDAGLDLSIHTDSRLMSGVHPSDEVASLVREGRFGWAEMARMGQLAARASFMSQPAKEAAEAAVAAWARAEAIELPAA
jgi:adenosine deaminase